MGFVGTPTAKVAVPIAEKSNVPYIAPFTGAEFLRNPYKKYVVNLRGSYYQEAEALVKYFVDQKGLKSISVFYQNDGYGRA
jgi:branched-chain amino acid transport system substrate-binding protein